MQKYNNPRLNGTVVSGTGMDHPVRPHVIVGDTKMGYVRGDLVDANAIEEIHVELDNKIKTEAKTRTSEDKKILDRIDKIFGPDASDDTINALNEVYKFLSKYKDTDNLFDSLNKLLSQIESAQTDINALKSNISDISTWESSHSAEYTELVNKISDIQTQIDGLKQTGN